MFFRISTYPRKKSSILFHSFLLNRGALTRTFRSQFYTENAMFQLFRREKNMKTNLTKQNRTEQNRTKEYASFFRFPSFSVLRVVIPCITVSSPSTGHPLREQPIVLRDLQTAACNSDVKQ